MCTFRHFYITLRCVVKSKRPNTDQSLESEMHADKSAEGCVLSDRTCRQKAKS